MESAGGGNAPSAEMEQSATHNQEFFFKHTRQNISILFFIWWCVKWKNSNVGSDFWR
jgi:hypothetical protein